MTISNHTIAFDTAALGAEMGQFKAACVRAENASTPFARKTLAGLMTDAITPAYVEQALLALFKPVTPKGKKGETLSSLRYAIGGDAARKATDTIFKIYENRDVSPECRETIIAFILEKDGCAKSLNALHTLVKGFVSAKVEADNVTEEAGNADDTTPEENGAQEQEQGQGDIGDMANKLILALESADVEALNMAQDRLEALFNAISDASTRLAESVEQEQATGTEG